MSRPLLVTFQVSHPDRMSSPDATTSRFAVGSLSSDPNDPTVIPSLHALLRDSSHTEAAERLARPRRSPGGYLHLARMRETDA